MNITEFDTIAAISTPPGEGAIGIVRLSGDDAVAIVDRLYQAGSKRLADVGSPSQRQLRVVWRCFTRCEECHQLSIEQVLISG